MTCLGKAFEDVTTRLIIHLLRTVEDVDHHPYGLPEVLCCFSLASASGPRRCSTHDQVERLGQGDVTPAHLIGGAGTSCQVHLSVRGVMTRRGVQPRYSCQYRNWASHMLAKQSSSTLSHLEIFVLPYKNLPHRCLSWDCQLKDWEESILWLIILLTFDRTFIFVQHQQQQQELTTSRECTSIVQIVITCTAMHRI